jgi:hypothetical protein
MASFNILKVGAPILAEAGGGAIACVGAAVVHYGIKHHEVWAAAKGAVEGETGREEGQGIGVNETKRERERERAMQRGRMLILSVRPFHADGKGVCVSCCGEVKERGQGAATWTQ